MRRQTAPVPSVKSFNYEEDEKRFFPKLGSVVLSSLLYLCWHPLANGM